MAKPDDVPEWATDADYPAGAHPWNETATKIEPIAGKKAEGFEPKEKPPAQILNWLFNLIYQWLAFLEPFFGDNGIVVPEQTRWQIVTIGLGHDANVGNAAGDGGVAATGAGAVCVNPCLIDLRPGDTIVDVRMLAATTGGVNTVRAVLKRAHLPSGYVETDVGTAEAIDEAAGTAFYTSDPIGYELDENEALFWRLEMDTAAQAVYIVGVTFSRPEG